MIDTLPGEAGTSGVPIRPKSSRAWRPVALAALLVTAGIVFLAFHPDQTRAVLAQVRLLPPWAPLAAFALVLAQLLAQGLRLWAVVPRRLALGPASVVSDWAKGEWLNMFAPARGGDALKIVLIKRRQGADPSALPSATGAVLADKVVDAVSILLLCGAGGLIGLLWSRAGGGLKVIVLAATLVLAAVAVLRLRAATEWIRSRRWLADFVAGFGALKDPARFSAGVGFSLTAWLAEGLALWTLCRGLGVVLGPSQVLLALMALNAGIIVPLALANLGVYEAALAAGLTQVGVPLPAAIAVAATHHGLQLLALNLSAAGLSLRPAHA